MARMAGHKYPHMWVDPEDDPRSQDAVLGDERATLLDYLRSYRLTLELKCSGLSAEQLATRSVPPSTMSLLGLVRHLAQVEQSWFRRVMAGEDVPFLYRREDDRDADEVTPAAYPSRYVGMTLGTFREQHTSKQPQPARRAIAGVRRPRP